eukprot:5186890-Pyramimonas_sp.AAC.3
MWWDTISTILQGSKLDADFMVSFNVNHCAEYFGLQIRHDVPGPHAAISISQPVRASTLCLRIFGLWLNLCGPRLTVSAVRLPVTNRVPITNSLHPAGWPDARPGRWNRAMHARHRKNAQGAAGRIPWTVHSQAGGRGKRASGSRLGGHSAALLQGPPRGHRHLEQR